MFKKFAVLIFSVVLMATMAVPAYASYFTPSVTGKDAPTVETQTGSDGNAYAAIIKDANGEEIAGVGAGAISVTPVSKIEEADGVIGENLTNAYEQIRTTPNLTDLFGSETTDHIDLKNPSHYTTNSRNPLVSAIAKYRQEVASDPASKNITVEDVVIRDLFDVSVSEEYKQHLDEKGNYITIRFELSADANTLVTVLHNIEGDTWEAIGEDRLIRNDNNTVDVVFYSLSPIAFAFDNTKLNAGSVEDPVEDPADDVNILKNSIVWIIVAVIVLAVIIIIVFKNKKSEKTTQEKTTAGKK